MEDWYSFALKEIDQRASAFPRRLKDEDKRFLESVRPRIKIGLDLTPRQEKWLIDIHRKMIYSRNGAAHV